MDIQEDEADLLDTVLELGKASVAGNLRGTAAAELAREGVSETVRERARWDASSGSYPRARAARRRWQRRRRCRPSVRRRKKKEKKEKDFSENPLGFSKITESFKTETSYIY